MTANMAVEQAVRALDRGGPCEIQAVANLAAAILIADQLQDIVSAIDGISSK